MKDYQLLSPAERNALKRDFFSSLHCALPGNIVSFDAEKQTAEIQPAVKVGSLSYPVLVDVPVFMPVPFEVHPGDACLVIFADVDIDAWLASGEPSFPESPRQHSLSDGFAFVGFRVRPADEKGGTRGRLCPLRECGTAGLSPTFRCGGVANENASNG